MPRAPKKCARCDATVKGRTYCPNCQPNGWHNNPSANHRAHTRDERRQFRDTVLELHPWCQACGVRPSTQADHKTPIELGGTNDPHTNGQGLCDPCHDAKTRAETRARNHRRRGGGSPPTPA